VTFSAAMRVGSLEMLAVLAAFGVLASRMRSAQPSRPKALSLALLVRENASRTPAREVRLTLLDGAPVVIGRAADADLPLADPDASRRHARLSLVRGVVYLADLGSSNGTFLNGKALSDESIELRPGDDVDVGNTRITLQAMEAPL
jgi:pSer/pThr/pTyr-binding forkhead associated (FHA) protein